MYDSIHDNSDYNTTAESLYNIFATKRRRINGKHCECIPNYSMCAASMYYLLAASHRGTPEYAWEIKN